VSGARITAQAPVLFVSDLSRSLAYWRDCVGFDTVSAWGEPPSFAILSHGGARLMLREAPQGHAIVPHWRVSPALWNAYFTQPYGVLEFGIRDPDDQDIGFGQVLDIAAN
jgi:hypothetical protein